MNVTLEDAYREACTAIGEGIVRERLLTAEVQRVQGLLTVDRAGDVDEA